MDSLDIILHQQPLYDAWISATYLLLTSKFKRLRRLKIHITPSFDPEKILDSYCRESLVNAIESLQRLEELVVTIDGSETFPLFQGIHRCVAHSSPLLPPPSNASLTNVHRAILLTTRWRLLATSATLPSDVRYFKLCQSAT